MMRTLLIAAAMVVAVGGCANIQYLPITDSVVTNERTSKVDYVLGANRFAGVGETVLRVQRHVTETVEANTMTPDRDFEASWGGQHFFSGSSGYPIRIVARARESDGRTSYALSQEGRNAWLLVTEDGQAWAFGRPLNAVTMTPTPPNVRFTRTTSTRISVDEDKPYENWELLFDGLIGDTIRMTYREYSREGLARTAFAQQLFFPANSSVIRYRGIEMHVASVTGEGVSFTVVAD